MPTITATQKDKPPKVLITGANGYVAVWTMKVLLDRGYLVRGTVRSAEKCAYLTELFNGEYASGKLEIVVVRDIAQEGAFDEAVKGVDGVLHTASPVVFAAEGSDPDDIIRPAVGGTVGIFESIRKYGSQVKRIVFTSSIGSICRPMPPPHEYDETDWNDPAVETVQKEGVAANGLYRYLASKVLAEKGAWEFHAAHSDELRCDMTVLHPPTIIGAMLQDVPSTSSINESMKLFYASVVAPELKDQCDPTLLAMLARGTAWVDVRDIALAHVLALEKEEAGGERILVNAGGACHIQDWLDVIHATSPSPLTASRQAVVPVGTPGLGKDFVPDMTFKNDKGRRLLGIEYTPLTDTVRDSVADFAKRGW